MTIQEYAKKLKYAYKYFEDKVPQWYIDILEKRLNGKSEKYIPGTNIFSNIKNRGRK